MMGDPPLICTASKLFDEARPMIVLLLIVAELPTMRFVGFKIVFSMTLSELLAPREMSPPMQLIFSESAPLATKLPFTCNMQSLGICMVTPASIVKVAPEFTVRFPVNIYGLLALVQVALELIEPLKLVSACANPIGTMQFNIRHANAVVSVRSNTKVLTLLPMLSFRYR